MAEGPVISVKYDRALLDYLGDVKAASKNVSAEIKAVEAQMKQLVREGKQIDKSMLLRVQKLKEQRAGYADAIRRHGNARERRGDFRDMMGLVNSGTLSAAMAGDIRGALMGGVNDAKDVNDLLGALGIKSQVLAGVVRAIPYAVIGSQIASSVQDMLARISAEKKEAGDIGKLYGAGKISGKLFEQFQKQHTKFFFRGDPEKEVRETMTQAAQLARLAQTAKGSSFDNIAGLRKATDAALQQARRGKRRPLTNEEEAQIREVAAQDYIAGLSTESKMIDSGAAMAGVPNQEVRREQSARQKFDTQLKRAAADRAAPILTNREKWEELHPEIRRGRYMSPRLTSQDNPTAPPQMWIGPRKDAPIDEVQEMSEVDYPNRWQRADHAQEDFRTKQDRLSGTGAERSSLKRTKDVNKD